jgi:hypothetical protein
MLEHRQVERGRFVLARFEPEYEYDLDVDRHNELLPLSQDREHAKEFRQFADVLRWAAREVRDGSCP